jgi:hypothetical protein
MRKFISRAGFTFYYEKDLSGEIYIAGTAARPIPCLRIPSIDFMEFAAHVAGLPPWEPEKDAYDHETTELMVRHVESCSECALDHRCSKYFEVILERVRAKERKAIH